jgi:intron-binding protein aquarius
MVNEKFRENVPAWGGFAARLEALPSLFERILALRAPCAGPGGRPWHTHERVTYLMFAIHAFQSLENEAVRRQVLRLVSLPLWHALSRGRLQVRPGPAPELFCE